MESQQGWWDMLQRWWDLWFIPFVPPGLENFPQNFALTVLLAVSAGLLGAPRLGLPRRRAVVWFLCLLVPLAYTLSSTGNPAVGRCSMGLTPWQFPGALFATDSRTNVLLLVPAGAAAFLFAAGTKRFVALFAALSIPVAIELTQLVAGHIGRSCQVFDVVYNLVGVLAGFWFIAGFVAVRQSLRIMRADPGS